METKISTAASSDQPKKSLYELCGLKLDLDLSWMKLIPPSSIPNNWKGPRLAFDWALGKGCACYDGKRFWRVGRCIDVLNGLTEPTLIITESSFLSFDPLLGEEKNEFLKAAFEAGHIVVCITPKQTPRYREEKSTDEVDAQAIYEASEVQHLSYPITREKPERPNKMMVLAYLHKEEIPMEEILKEFPLRDRLTEDDKAAFCNADGKYAEPLLKDIYFVVKVCQPKNRNEFEKYLGLYGIGFPTYMRSEVQNRNLKDKVKVKDPGLTKEERKKKSDAINLKSWQNKTHTILPWKRFRKAIRKMYHFLTKPKERDEIFPSLVPVFFEVSA